MKRNNLFWLIAGLVIIAIFFLPIISLDYQKSAINLIHNYPYLAPLLVVIFRFFGVVVAPLPGAPVAFASMAVLPWPEAWAYNFIGTELGAITAFFIARRFREAALAYLAPLEKIHQWQEKISQTKQFWGFAGLRLVSLVAFDFVSYAAGLTKLSFPTFIMATLLIDVPVGFLFFYFGGLAVQYSLFLFGAFAVIFMVVLVFWSYYKKEK